MIAGYLGPKYTVRASQGHVRDLPTSASEVPAKYKGEPWARTGVNVDNEFTPVYVVSPEKRSTIRELKSLLKDADELLLATDGDREGRPSPGICLTSSNRRCRCAAWCSTRSPRRPSTRPSPIPESLIQTSLMPRRPDASLTVSTVTRCPRCCGRRYCHGCRQVACSRWLPG